MPPPVRRPAKNWQFAHFGLGLRAARDAIGVRLSIPVRMPGREYRSEREGTGAKAREGRNDKNTANAKDPRRRGGGECGRAHGCRWRRWLRCGHGRCRRFFRRVWHGRCRWLRHELGRRRRHWRRHRQARAAQAKGRRAACPACLAGHPQSDAAARPAWRRADRIRSSGLASSS